MRLLVLGGTVFVGRHLVDQAMGRGHEVTIFNRAITAPGLFPGIEHLVGDRDGDLSALAGRTWDAAIDTCGYVPRLVRDSAALLSGSVDHYTFVSSVSVYADTSAGGVDESAPVGRLGDETVEEVTGETYGPLKALCEQAAEDEMPGRVLVVRPGLIVGPYDPTDRFTYWPRRVAGGGRVLAPGEPSLPVQAIDVRDLASWILNMAEARAVGIYNATGPAAPLAMGDFLATCRAVSGSDAELMWVDEDTLLGAGVVPFTELPLWVPAEGAGTFQVAIDKALAEGLRLRPMAETVRDTLKWDSGRPADQPRRAGLTQEREAELLALADKRR
ncbi:MAG: SDR family oxidoreductase [Anaerolineae bacterium]